MFNMVRCGYMPITMPGGATMTTPHVSIVESVSPDRPSLPTRSSSRKSNKKRCEADSYSTASMASKASREKQKSSSRFSLRHLNFFSRRQSSSAKSVRSLRSNNSEVETRSVTSLHYSHAEREPVRVCSEKDGAGRTLIECPLCLCHLLEDSFPLITTCHHRSCQDCLRQYLRIEIMESRVNIACPECSERFHPNDVYRILDDRPLIEKYEEFMLRRILVTEPDARWCPAPDCTFAVIASGCASCPKLKCERPGCGTSFCYHCKQYWHPNQTCDAARAERASNLRSSSVSYSHESNSQSEIKPCPRCGAFIIKMDDGSCNHMTCAVCGAEFCWLCMKEISDLHYLSPSGCTFWGKKPWSRKKKILWQLGTLVGAPVGIGLVAGIAIPAMIIGIPVWVGRKIHAKYEHSPKHKRNLLITGGVTASVVVSPILAGLVVGIGVPILLAYVYGVVPISLCRSGGCGVTTTDGGGVRFEFEEENEGTVGQSGPYPGGVPDAQSVDTHSHQVANPSIGPSIGEMSVGMTNSLSASGSHIDRVGSMRDESDRDSASNRALIGASLNGSLSGSAVAGPSGFHNRMEVHADVAASTAKRNSISSESANISLDAKSATVSFSDDASTKALAGSICTQDKDNTSAIIPPLEVQVDVINSAAKYRRHSGSSPTEPICSAMKSPTASNGPSPGSPTSTRSVSFIGEEVICHRPSKRYKRQSLSVDDKINEQVEHPIVARESVSVRSFMEEDCTLELGAGAGTCIGATDNLDRCGGGFVDNVPPYTPPYPIANKSANNSSIKAGSTHSSSMDTLDSVRGIKSIRSASSTESRHCCININPIPTNLTNLTEVESDRPLRFFCQSASLDQTTAPKSPSGSTPSSETMSPDTLSEPTLTLTQNVRWSHHSNCLTTPSSGNARSNFSTSRSESYLRHVP